MKKFIIWFVLLTPVLTQAAEYRNGENVQISGQITDTLFAVGESVESDFISNEDVFLAGQNLNIHAQTSENLFVIGAKATMQDAKARMAIVAGGDVLVHEAKFHDLLIIGGNVTIADSMIDDDLLGGAGKLVINRNTKVLGAATLAAGNLEFDGTAAKDSILGGEDITLNGTFLGNVEVRANRLKVGPNAIIQGTLTHQAEAVEISPSASIAGGTKVLLTEAKAVWPITAMQVLAATLFGFGILLVPALVALLMPTLVARGRTEINTDAPGNIGRGLVAILLVPFAIFFLFSTIVGIPLGIVSLALTFIVGVLAYSVGIFMVADRLRSFVYRSKQTLDPLEERPAPRFTWTLLTATVFALLTTIPVLGALLCFLVLLAGVGALCVEFKGMTKWTKSTDRNRADTTTVQSDLKVSSSVT